MKQTLKKSLIIGASIGTPIVILASATSAYFASPILERISKKGIYTIRVNENLNNEGYKYDLSATYGSPLATSYLTLLLNNEILHLKSEGKFVYDQENSKVIQPSYESYKFGLANGIVLTFVDSTVKQNEINNEFFEKPENKDKFFQLVFDSDDSSVIPELSDEKKEETYVITKESKDPKSINNPNVFLKLISDGFVDEKIDLDNPNLKINDSTTKKYALVNMGLTFNTGAKWVDSNGNETKYEIQAKDMFYSIKRTWLYDRNYRLSHGGNQELDKYFVDKTSTLKRFGQEEKFPNEYLFDFFGIEKDKLYNEDTAIQKVNIGTQEETEAFTFWFNIYDQNGSIDKNTTYFAQEIIKKYLSNALTFSLAPSDYIDEVFNAKKYNTTPVGEITGEAAKYGIYTYGQTREQTLYASTYIPTYSVSGREIFEYNKHYANKEWVKSVEEGEIIDGKLYKTINKVIIEYSGGIDGSTFINQSFTSFMSGTLSQIDYSQITDAQKEKLYGTSNNLNDLILNSEKNGLQATKKVNISSLTSRMVWQANPINEEGQNIEYGFNDLYSQIVYGHKIEDLKSGKASTTTSYYSGAGFKFRLLIQSSINWQSFISQAFSGTRDVWVSGAAQHAKFSSTDPNSLTPSDFNESGINDLFFYDKDGNLKTLTLKEMKELQEMTAEQIKDKYGEEAAQNIQRTKMQSPHFKTIQESMKALLDEFYKNNNISSSEKIKFEIAYPFSDQDPIKSEATRYVVEEVINKIDPRIQATFIKPTSRDEMLNSINKRRTAFQANLWSYDYEGIGSYIAAFASDGGGTNLLSSFAIFSRDIENDGEEYFKDVVIDGITIKRASKEEITKLQSDFPKYTELAKYVRKQIEEEFGDSLSTIDSKIKIQNWDLINNKDNNALTKFFLEDSSNTNKVNPIVSLPIIFKKFESEASWEKLETPDKKGEGWTQLIKEINAIKGVSIDTESSIELLSKVNYTLYLREYIVPLSKYGVQFYSDFKYEVQK